MNSTERHAARRRRREPERAARRAERQRGCDLDAITDMNALYRAQRQAARGVSWKASTQRYQINWLLNIHRMRWDLIEGRSIHRGFHEFDLFERGKKRHISSVHFSERVPQKALAQNVLIPCLTPRLIGRNTANIKGRGLSCALDGLRRDLTRHVRRHGVEGYILLTDFSGYFGSLDHGHVAEMLVENVADERALTMALALLDLQGDVGLGLGCEPNQIEAVAYPDRIDHYVTEVLRPEAYGRYMDDAYMLDPSKEHLQWCLQEFAGMCGRYGLAVNAKKTRIVKLTKGFTWLKKRVHLSGSGRIVMRPSRETVTRERRKLKRMARAADEGRLDGAAVARSYQSWRGSLVGLDAFGTVAAMDRAYKQLVKGAGND